MLTSSNVKAAKAFFPKLLLLQGISLSPRGCFGYRTASATAFCGPCDAWDHERKVIKQTIWCVSQPAANISGLALASCHNKSGKGCVFLCQLSSSALGGSAGSFLSPSLPAPSLHSMMHQACHAQNQVAAFSGGFGWFQFWTGWKMHWLVDPTTRKRG